MQVYNYRGTFAKLRQTPCAHTLKQFENSSPTNAFLIFDQNALKDVFSRTLKGLTNPMVRNTIIVPELVLDFFDMDDKQLRRQMAYDGNNGDRWTKTQYVMKSELKAVLLDPKEYNMEFQRVDQYDMDFIRQMNIVKKSCDGRLLIACARYYAAPAVLKEASKEKVYLITTAEFINDEELNALARDANIFLATCNDFILI